MYLRFITRFINEFDKPQTGLFHAAGFIREHRSTSDLDELLLGELRIWFKENFVSTPTFS